MTRTERAIWGPPSSSQPPTFTSSLPAMHFTLTLHPSRNICQCNDDMCVGICFIPSRSGCTRALVRVMCVVFSSPCCIHRLSHRSMYRWGCNYVPQWSSLCFFTAQELSRQRSVWAPWKLPAENHMAMRAIMDFFFPLRIPLLTFSLSSLYLFSLCFSFVNEHLRRCQSMGAFRSNLLVSTSAALWIISPEFSGWSTNRCTLFLAQ